MEEKGTTPTMSAYSFVYVGTVKGQHLGHLQRRGWGVPMAQMFPLTNND